MTKTNKQKARENGTDQTDDGHVSIVRTALTAAITITVLLALATAMWFIGLIFRQYDFWSDFWGTVDDEILRSRGMQP